MGFENQPTLKLLRCRINSVKIKATEIVRLETMEMQVSNKLINDMLASACNHL